MRIGIIESNRVSGGGGVSDLTTNLKGYWKMNDVQANAAIYDALGVHNGAIVGSVTKDAVGKFDRAVTFSGGSVEIPHSDDFNIHVGGNNLSLSGQMWVNYSTVTDGWLICKRVGGSYGWQLAFYQGSLRVDVFNTDNASITSTKPYTFTAGTWYYVGFSFDVVLGQIKIYVNAIELTGGSHTGTVKTLVQNTTNLIMGKFSSFTFKGRQDEVALWQNRVITPDEFIYQYNNGVGREIPIAA